MLSKFKNQIEIYYNIRNPYQVINAHEICNIIYVI